MTDTHLYDPRLAQPDLDDEGMAKLLNIPLNRLETLIDAKVYRFHLRGEGPRPLRRYTPEDIHYNRETVGLVEPEPVPEPKALPAQGISDPASIPAQRLVKAVNRRRGSTTRSTSTA